MKSRVLCSFVLVTLSTVCVCATAATATTAQSGPDLHIGGMAHGRGNIDLLAQLDLGNFIWIPPTYYWESGNIPWDATHTLMDDVAACREHGFAFLISQRRGLGDGLRHGGFEYGGHGSGEVHDATAIRGVIAAAGGLFLGLHQEEMDADFIQEAWRPSYRARMPDLYNFTDRAGGRRAFEGELSRIHQRYRGWGAASWPNLCVTGHLSGFRSGADGVMAEFLEHLTTTELQLALLRGGARQFGGRWGAWVSPWWWGEIPCEDPDYWSTPRAVEGGGHSVASFRRALWLAYASGASVLTAQETEPLYRRDGAGGFALTAWGRELKGVWDHARRHPQPRTPLVATAVLVDADWGWAPAHLWQDWIQEPMVWGKLPAERSDAMAAAFLDMLLPGFGRSRERVMERRDIYPGYFAATPHGPFDIVASDAGAETLAAYRNVLAVGEIAMTGELLQTLRTFVRGGGRLFVNALHLRHGEAFVQDPEFLGLRFDVGGTYAHVRTSNRVRVVGDLPGARTETGEGYYCMVGVQAEGAAVLADDGQGHPVLLSHPFGEGTVFVSTPEYMLTGFGDRRARLAFFAETLPLLLEPGEVAVTGDPDVSWIACRQGDDSLLVVAANHAPEPASVTVTIGGEWLPVENALAGPGGVVAIPAEDVAVLRFQRAGQSGE